MNRTPRDTSHRDGALAQRLTRLALLASALALLVAGTVLNLAMFLISRDALIDEARAQAQVMAANLDAPLMFRDAVAARETLDSLQRSNRIERASLYDSRGALYARYSRGEATSFGLPAAEPQDGLALRGSDVLWPAGQHIADRYLVVDEAVGRGKTRVGMLRLEVPLTPLYQRSLAFGGFTLAAAALAMLLAWLLAVGVRRDVARIERRLDHLAYRDPVTGLLNRHAAVEHLDRLVNTARSQRTGFSVITVDLDDFKLINDTLGHQVGDQVLRRIAGRLVENMHRDALAFRFGGDEFVVICPCTEGYADPLRYGELARYALDFSVDAGGRELRMGGSVGVARFPEDGNDAQAVLRASDMAMYAAKQRGKNQLVIYEPTMGSAGEQVLQVESELRRALREGELRLYYQPVVCLADGRITGAEALIRWQHPQRGLVMPGEFIAIAERSALIVELGGWVLQEAARQLAAWQRAGLPPLWVSVNASARQLRHGVLEQQYEEAVQRSGCDPRRLELELTEHTLIEDIDSQVGLLARLRERGVVVAIDDFGTGLSSLSYLQRLPVSKLKIDRSFVTGLPGNEGDTAIVGATLAMAHAFGLRVVAEGIETAAQRDLLASLGCDDGQGYFYSRPMPAAAFEHLLRDELSATVPGELSVSP